MFQMSARISAKLIDKIVIAFGLLIMSTTSVWAQEQLGSTQLGAGISLRGMNKEYSKHYPFTNYMNYEADGGDDARNEDGTAKPGYFDPSKVKGASPFGTYYPPTPAAKMGFKTDSKLMQGLYETGVPGVGGFSGLWNSDLKETMQKLQAATVTARTTQFPTNAGKAAQAQQQSQGIGAGNAMGEAAKGQASAAINYCAEYMQNFTVEDGNIWNKIRLNIFIPIAILLLLPGAVLTQVKVIAGAGNPTLGGNPATPDIDETNPFSGIFRSVIAIFLILSSNLIVNYGIDFSNSIILSISSEYQILFGSNMYADALGAEVRAFPVRGLKREQNTGTPDTWQQGTVDSQASFEKNFINNTDSTKVDEAMPSGAMASRLLANTGNAGMTAAWNILCAFQMAYLHYLYFVGPIMAALWVWPVAQLRSAFSSWVEGVITICCWSLFWNTVILLMACFKGVDDTGTIIMSALNFLSTACVKFAFDFAGLVQAAGAQAAQQAMQAGGSGSGGKGGGKGGAAGAHGGKHAGHSAAHHKGLPGHGKPQTGHPTKGNPTKAHPTGAHPAGAHPTGPHAAGPHAAGPHPAGPHQAGLHQDSAKPVLASFTPPSANFGKVPAHGLGSEPPMYARNGAAGSKSTQPHSNSVQTPSGTFSAHVGADGTATGVSFTPHSGSGASFNQNELSKGGPLTQSFDGGKLSLSKGPDRQTNVTANLANGSKEQFSIGPHGEMATAHNGGPETAAGNLSDKPGAGSIAMPGNGGSSYLSADGQTLSVPNANGGYDSAHLPANGSGKFDLGGQSFNFSHAEGAEPGSWTANVKGTDATGATHSAAVASEGPS